MSGFQNPIFTPIAMPMNTSKSNIVMKTQFHPRRHLLAVLASLVLAAALTAPRAADAFPPARLTYQGFLVDGNGAPLASANVQNFDVIFRIYTASQGGTILWSEQQTVTVDKGNFSVLLGDGSAVGSEPRPALDTVFLGTDVSDRYVGITVKGLGGADAEILPRLRLLTSPFTFLAKNATALVGPAGQTLFNFSNGAIQSTGGNPRGANAVDLQTVRVDATRVAAGGFSVIGGGADNLIGGTSANSVIAGGVQNILTGTNSSIAGGIQNTNTGLTAAIGGGFQNSNSGRDSVIAGGNNNNASAFASSIGGGFFNKVNRDLANVSGGQNNLASGVAATVGGGVDSLATGDHATVAGGNTNRATGLDSTVGGGFRNLANGTTSTIGGGSDNTASGFHAFIGGGGANAASGEKSVIGGGVVNTNKGLSATIGGGFRNYVTGQESVIGGGNQNSNNVAFWATIGGGIQNVVNGEAGVVAGGSANHADGFHGAVLGGFANSAGGFEATVGGGQLNNSSAFRSTIAGGNSNGASGDHSAVGGGHENVATGLNSMIPGGYRNRTEGEASMAAGYRSKANATGAYAWSSRETIDFTVTTPNAYAIRATGGVHIYTNPTEYGAVGRLGMYMPQNGTAWVAHSDRNMKKNFEECDYKDVLEKLDEVPVTYWNYKGEDDATPKHLGPVSQDFKSVFYRGTDDKGISTLDFDGVELAAIKGLRAAVKEKDAEIKDLKRQMDELRAMVESIGQSKAAGPQ